MRAALLASYHSPLELVEREVPEPTDPTDVVVRIGGAGVCATDLHSIDGWMEEAGVRPPRVLGHENAGWVAAVGEGVSTCATALESWRRSVPIRQRLRNLFQLRNHFRVRTPTPSRTT